MEESFLAGDEGDGVGGGGLIGTAEHVQSCRAVRASKRGVYQLMGCLSREGGSEGGGMMAVVTVNRGQRLRDSELRFRLRSAGLIGPGRL